jgi:succinate dehydrogenase / fumarate reductase cytochrome b subunit
VKPIRPKNLNLFTIHFPIPAIVSILHRVSGAFLFLLVPFTLWALAFSLTDSGFETLRQDLSTGCCKFIIWVTLAALCYHLVAGIRHLLMDIGIGSSLKAGRIGARLTLIVSAVVIMMIGIWLW